MARSVRHLKNALRRFQSGVFTDADVTRCTGLSARSIREMIKAGFVRTLSADRGAGRIRTFDATAFKRLAVVAVVHDAGFRLQLAGELGYLFPGADLLYRTCDPVAVLDPRVSSEPYRDLPARLAHARADWFDPDKPAAVDPEHDTFIEIFERRFVALVSQNGRFRLVYGDLRKDGTEFVGWWPAFVQLVENFSAHADGAPMWEGQRLSADLIDPRFLINYRFEDHRGNADPLKVAGYAAVWRPISTNTINVSLAVRLALRRYLGIEPLANPLFAELVDARHGRLPKTRAKSGEPK